MDESKQRIIDEHGLDVLRETAARLRELGSQSERVAFLAGRFGRRFPEVLGMDGWRLAGELEQLERHPAA